MNSIYKISFILFGFLFLYSCTKEVEAESTFESKTFIFGIITNDIDNIFITISKTVPLNSGSGDILPLSNSVSNAEISLYTKDTNGNTSLVTDDFMYLELQDEYMSSQVIIPVIGNYYWIEVLVDDILYKSAEELLKTPIPIDNTLDVNNNTRIEFADPSDETNLYLARLVLYNNQNDLIFEEFAISNDVLFNGNENAFIDIFQPFDNNAITNLAQLNYGTYQFYRNLITQQDSNQGGDDESGSPGRLFDLPPANITGNILNTSTNRYALGNFGVISTNE